MGYCVIEHTYHSSTENSKSQGIYSLYSEFSSIIEKVQPPIRQEGTFCHIPSIRVIPNWNDSISMYASDGDTLQVDIFPIQLEVIKKFHNEYSTTRLPEKFNSMLREAKQQVEKSATMLSPSNQLTSPRMRVHHISDVVFGRAFNVAMSQKPPCSYTKALPHLIYIKTGNVKKDIPALWFKCSMKSSTSIEPVTIMYMHDCGEDLGLITSSLELLTETMHCNILAFEYPSYGLFDQPYSDELLATNAEYVYSYITSILHKPTSRLILCGKGVGAAVSLMLASKKKTKKNETIAAGVIMISPKMDPSTFGKGIFENAKMIKMVKIPVFAIYGQQDRFAGGMKKLQSIIKNAQDFICIPEASDDIESSYYNEYSETLSSFIVKLFPEFSLLFNGAELEKMKPNKYNDSPIEVMKKLLTPLGLEQYAEVFICFGYISQDDLFSMDDEELAMIGLPSEDLSKLKEFLKKKRSNSSHAMDKRIRGGSMNGPNPITPDLTNDIISPPKTPHF
ncbi:hypothetical protein KM1_008520 [Entamoeba histolytica HM-3:IMSS]|uniref:SAM domain-containing protein n=2 Tax=Entamoeba histolytica TaxID=5759 RepID=M2RFC5_ENTHI|nr:Hypothetical protein EHI5A_008970 [Entamoeba histolytica KU27]EMS17737.1 hypothetical protein KM1_008520 [Entamoeba histolytica HM-3:IMSS]